MMKMVDMSDLGSDPEMGKGSSPFSCNIYKFNIIFI